MKKITLVSLIVVAIIAIIGVFSPQTTVVERVVEKLGASAGPEHYVRQSFKSGSTNGGVYATTTTAATYTVTRQDLNGTPTLIDWTPNINTTLSLSGTSTHAYVPNIGDVASVYIRNASSTEASTITLAAVDSGLDLQEDEGETVIINGLEVSRLNFLRVSENLVTAWLEVGQIGD